MANGDLDPAPVRDRAGWGSPAGPEAAGPSP